MLAAMGEVSGKRVIELGCGTGHYAQVLGAAGARVEAYDRVEEMVEVARAAGVDARVGDAASLSTSPAALVLCAGMLEFVDDPEIVVHNALAHALEAVVLLLPEQRWSGRVYRRWHRTHGVEARLFTEDDVARWAKGWTLASVQRAGLFALVCRLERP